VTRLGQQNDDPQRTAHNRAIGGEHRGAGVANQVGKRYQCEKCNTEMIVTKGGSGQLECCGQPMKQK
jgi:hypothetical protein